MPTVNEIGHEPAQETSVDRSQATPREFDILDLFLILAARKRLIFWFSVGGFVLGVLLVLMVAPTFTAKAVILPPQQDQSSGNAFMGQFGALASMTGLGSSLGIKNPVDLYLGMLQSQTVTDGIIKRFDLVHVYHPKRFSDLRNMVVKKAKFIAGKDGMISISVTDKDPRMAAAMANAFVDELYQLNNRLAIGGASQRRLFYEQQLAQEKDKLADSEVALAKTEEATGVIAPTGQTENIIRQVAQLQAEITAREVQLDALRTSSTEQNPDVVRLNSELTGLREQLRGLESGTSSTKHAPGDIFISTANVPQAGLEYIRKERDVKYHQFLFDLLARQYESARIDEAKAAPVIQVVDTAQVPDRRSAPTRAMWAIVGCFLGFFFTVSWVFASHIYHRVEADETHGRRLAVLRQELRRRG
jgi:tyrosine-protein kinase Etk/Wzc